MSRSWPSETRIKALALVDAGKSIDDVEEELGVPGQTIRWWLRPCNQTVPVKPKKREGSGVIAPPPYAEGFRWWNTRW